MTLAMMKATLRHPLSNGHAFLYTHTALRSWLDYKGRQNFSIGSVLHQGHPIYQLLWAFPCRKRGLLACMALLKVHLSIKSWRFAHGSSLLDGQNPTKYNHQRYRITGTPRASFCLHSWRHHHTVQFHSKHSPPLWNLDFGSIAVTLLVSNWN